MLSLLTGTPGSGKTLLAIDNIVKIANSESDEFLNIERVFTNISGFKYDKFKDNKVKFSKFIFKDFYPYLTVLRNLYYQHETDDNLSNILKDYCIKYDLLNAYFIIDESQNYFDNQDKVLVWWFTYHRHLNHEILLITQNKSLINTVYRNIPEIFIKAQPRSKAISKNVLRYFNYTEYRMTQKFSTTEITINDTYFSLYDSGNKSSQKRVGVKFVIFFIVAFICLLSAFSFLGYKIFIQDSLSSNVIDSNIDNTNSNPILPVINNSLPLTNTDTIDNTNDLSNLKYMQLLCSIKHNYCLYHNETINLDFYLKMKELKKFQEFSLTKTIGDFYSLDVFVSEDFYSIYNKSEVRNNEKNNINSSTNQGLSIFK